MKLKTNLKAGIKMCPLRGCGGGTDGEDPKHNQSTTGLKLKTNLKAGIKTCPVRNCGGTDGEDPNHNQSIR